MSPKILSCQIFIYVLNGLGLGLGLSWINELPMHRAGSVTVDSLHHAAEDAGVLEDGGLMGGGRRICGWLMWSMDDRGSWWMGILGSDGTWTSLSVLSSAVV